MFDKSIQILLMHVAKLLNVHNASFLSGEKDAFLSRKWGIKSINFSCANRFTMPLTMLIFPGRSGDCPCTGKIPQAFIEFIL
jgi:hypothetical protein